MRINYDLCEKWGNLIHFLELLNLGEKNKLLRVS